jgi:LmbE family N-acetylglucosaminyl deacetylase
MRRRPVPAFPGRFVVLSPHIDDAVLSLGAFIAAAARRGAVVEVVTVLANDPASDGPAGEWDATCGFRSEGAAARHRRREDERACHILGARTAWLPFGDETYDRGGSDGDIWELVAKTIDGAAAVLVPGFPLVHPDHAWLTRLLLRNAGRSVSIGLYLEQPYATSYLMGQSRRRGNASSLPEGIRYLARFTLTRGRNAHGRGPTIPEELLSALPAPPPPWRVVPAGTRDRIAKQRAVAAYASQRLGPFCRTRISLYELGLGGETVLWLP